ncbi:hypothetical protein BJ546DRAFT_147965 [Cryomyces antarcticus]
MYVRRQRCSSKLVSRSTIQVTRSHVRSAALGIIGPWALEGGGLPYKHKACGSYASSRGERQRLATAAPAAEPTEASASNYSTSRASQVVLAHSRPRSPTKVKTISAAPRHLESPSHPTTFTFISTYLPQAPFGGSQADQASRCSSLAGSS